MAAETKEREDLIAEMEEVLPLTVGDGSVYRTETDNEGVRHVNKEKVMITGQQLGNQIKPNWKGLPRFTEDYKYIASTGRTKTYSHETISKVNTGGIVGNLANQVIKNKYGQK